MASFISPTPITSTELNVENTEDNGGRGSMTSSCITSNIPSTTGITVLPINAMASSSSFSYENSGSSGCSSLSNSPTSSSASVSASTSTPMNSENCLSVSPITPNRNLLGESFQISTKNYSTSILRHQTSNNTNDDFNIGTIIGSKSKTDNSSNSISSIIMTSPHVTPIIFEPNKQATTGALEGPIHDIQFDSLRDNLSLDYSFQEPQQQQQQHHIHSSQQNQLMLPQENYMHQTLPTLNNDDARTLQLAVELSSMMNLNQHLMNENNQQLQSQLRFDDTNTNKYYSYASYELNTSTSNKSLLQPLSYNASLTNQSIINSTLNETSAIVPLGTLSEERSKKSQNMTECVPVPSSEHVAEIVGRQGCKIKALRAKTNTYIKTPVRNEEPVFVVTGRKEDVNKAKCEILSAAEHFTLIRATRRGEVSGGIIGSGSGGGVGGGGSGGAIGVSGSGGSTMNCGYLTNNDLFDNNNSLTTRNSLGSTGITHGQVTIQVRVPYRVVGLVVGPKGNTIKHIQHETQTYIVTPSRDKEPIFEVTGFLYNVQAARKHIEAHIAMRTGSTGTSLITANAKDKNTEASSSTNTTSLGANLPVTSKLSNESFIMNRLTNHYNSKELLNAPAPEQHISGASRNEAKAHVANILTTGANESVLQYCSTTKDDRLPLSSDGKLESISPYKNNLSMVGSSSSSTSPSNIEVNLMSSNRVESGLSSLNTHMNHMMNDKNVCQMDILPSVYEKGNQNLPYECQQQSNVQQQAPINAKFNDSTVTIGNILKLGLSSSGDTCGSNLMLNRSNGNNDIDSCYIQDMDVNKQQQQKQLPHEIQVIPINGSSNFSLPLSDVYDNFSDQTVQTVHSIGRNKPSNSINNPTLPSASLKVMKSSNKCINAVNTTEMSSCLGNGNTVLTRCCSSASSNASSSSKSLSQYSNCNGIANGVANGNGNGITSNSNSITLKKKAHYHDTLEVDEGIGESPNIWKLPKKLGVITSSYCPNTIHGDPADTGDPNAYSNYNETRNKPIIIHGPLEHNGKTRIKRDCCICHEKEMVAALIPCGHKMFCVNCANSICTSKEPVCPFCCMRVYQAVKILN